MRLLNVLSLKVESGFDDAAARFSDSERAQRKLWDMEPSQPSYAIPPYAILSHRWVGQEVVFQDFESVPKVRFQNLPPANPVPQTAVGAAEDAGQGSAASVYKIAGACAKVRELNKGTRHIWIDTVCINKLDGRELSSALNSMFKWYHNATICYVYLVDVTWDLTADPAGSRRQFLESKWFKRGWTLQELLAPTRLEFFDRNWRHIGSKQDLVDQIERATGISQKHMLGDFRAASTAQKMSWLSRRTTSIIEDRAYCMLGLFGVFLDPRYGQGADEFMRLQREIFLADHRNGIFDESLFAWTTDVIESSGLLAPAPSCFRNSGAVVFERSLAKSRRERVAPRSTAPEDGVSIDKDYAVDLHIPWVAKNHRGALTAVHLLTFGTATIAGGLANSANRRSKSEHLVNLNCWFRGQGRELRNVRIMVAQEKDKTWRRIQCNKLFESSNDDLYSQADVHGSAGHVFFPHQIKWNKV